MSEYRINWPAEQLILLSEDEIREAKLVTRILAALEIAHSGGIDGAHHKQWVIDQMVRALTGDKYDEWVKEHKAGDDGPDTYDWDEGIAP